jgi:hypothetical protein
MASLSYALGRLFGKKVGFRPFLAIFFSAMLLGVASFFLSQSSPAKGTLPNAKPFNLEQACAGERLQKYRALMEKKDYWMASLEMTACGLLTSHPEYKDMVMAAELAHYEREIATSGREKSRQMKAVGAMLLRSHAVPESLAVEYEKYKKTEAIQAEADRIRLKKSQGVSIGMTQKEVLASSWGLPQKVNTTTRASGVSEQWVYVGGYLYFENGVLRTIQN